MTDNTTTDQPIANTEPLPLPKDPFPMEGLPSVLSYTNAFPGIPVPNH